MAGSFLMHHVFKRHFFLSNCGTECGFQVVTFYFIIKLGGIPTSGGLVLTNINQTLVTLPRQKIWYSTSMFVLYMASGGFNGGMVAMAPGS